MRERERKSGKAKAHRLKCKRAKKEKQPNLYMNDKLCCDEYRACTVFTRFSIHGYRGTLHGMRVYVRESEKDIFYIENISIFTQRMMNRLALYTQTCT